MPTQTSFDFARVGLYGGSPINKAQLKAKRKEIYKRAIALRKASRPPENRQEKVVGSPPENQLKLDFMEE